MKKQRGAMSAAAAGCRPRASKSSDGRVWTSENGELWGEVHRVRRITICKKLKGGGFWPCRNFAVKFWENSTDVLKHLCPKSEDKI